MSYQSGLLCCTAAEFAVLMRLLMSSPCPVLEQVHTMNNSRPFAHSLVSVFIVARVHIITRKEEMPADL
jgi:hypothetical protein